MSFKPSVERWRQLVTWEAKDLPVNYVLSVIQGESAGIPGRISDKKRFAGPYPMTDRAGKTVQIDRDLGLMQVSPILAKTFNNDAKTSPQVVYEDFTGKTERDCRIQIRVGCYGLAFNVMALHKHYPGVFQATSARNASDDHLRFALMGNALGPSGLRQRLNAMHKKGLPLTWENFRTVYGKSLSQWVLGVDRRWKRFLEAGGPSREYEGVTIDVSPTTPPAPGPTTAMALQKQPDYKAMTPTGAASFKDKATGFLKDNWWMLLLMLGAYLMSRDETGQRRLNALMPGTFAGEPTETNPTDGNISKEPLS